MDFLIYIFLYLHACGIITVKCSTVVPSGDVGKVKNCAGEHYLHISLKVLFLATFFFFLGGGFRSNYLSFSH